MFRQLLFGAVLTGLVFSSVSAQAPPLVPVTGWKPVYKEPYPTAIFNWTPRAKYHDAAVIVRAGSAGGSGTQFVCGELAGVLTARHVVSGSSRAMVRYADGKQLQGDVLVASGDADVAYIAVYNPDAPHVHIAPQAPAVGAWTETFGFGGPKDTLRHFSGRVLRHSGTTTYYSQSVLNGDSGGGILDKNRELVGVNSFGTGPGADGAIAYYKDWPIYADSGSAHHSQIKAFVGRLCQRFGRRARWGGFG